MPAYSLLDRILHRLALQIESVAELSFDLDQRSLGREPAGVANERHVFVSGLARAGTTALMRRFHASGAYRSLTYRDMPFVLAPNLWRKLATRSARAAIGEERAHGDGIRVDVDSPESLDEVFWRIFTGPDYIARSHLRPHCPDATTLRKFVDYVGAILVAQDSGATRYLSKNNNNVLRLAAIREAFPQALILVPFRAPAAQAASLLGQHRQLCRLQREDGFVRSYMTWLVHHEFGLDHRPFRFDGQPAAPVDRPAPEDPDYWLRRWLEAYDWLERMAPADAVFVCYEDLCGDAGVWDRLAALAGLSAEAGAGEPFRAGGSGTGGAPGESALERQATELYARLRARAQAATG